MHKSSRQLSAVIYVIMACACLTNSAAKAQRLKLGHSNSSAKNTVTRSLISSDSDDPGFPPRGARVHGDTLYIEGTQHDDVIWVYEGRIWFLDPSLFALHEFVALEEIDMAEVDGYDGTVDVVVYGLAGNDHIIVIDIPATIFAGRGDDTIQTLYRRSTVFGQAGDDTIFGSVQDDVLAGQDGNDTIWGRRGSDLIDGGDGDDRLAGTISILGDGEVDTTDGAADYLGGGNGSDTFVLHAIGDTPDIVLDYNAAEDSLD